MWTNIIGQQRAIEKLKTAFSNGTVAHAYLFHGNEGTGKDAAAIEFAKLLNCLAPVNGNEACGKCENCIKISGFRSEYFKLICAIPAGKSDDADSDPIEKLSGTDFEVYMEQLTMKSKNPYYRINIPNANNIRINSIRDLISKAYLSTDKKRKKVFVISEADKMKQEASNALLKILEEPPRSSVLILTTSKPNALPPTVIGRCQNIPFEPLPEQLIAKKLMGQPEFINTYSADEISLASKLCMGSYSKAAELLELGITGIRETAIQFLISIVTKKYSDIISMIRSMALKNNKDRLKYLLFFLNVWFRDLLKVKYSEGALQIQLANFDIKDRLERFNGNYPETDIFSVIMILEESEKYITQNVYIPLILLNLSFKLKNLIH